MNESVSSSEFQQAKVSSLEQFRPKTRKLVLHPAERLLLWIVSTHLVFLPWALGGMREWAQWISLGFAIVGFVTSLVPRDYEKEHTGAGSFRLIIYPKLIKFPIFWLGIAMLIYIAIQAINPAWEYVSDGHNWWMQRISYSTWLPSGVRVPFETWGPWRMFVIYAAAWLTVCSVWVGFTRRRTAQALFIVIATNGLTLAGLGVAQKLLSNGKMFWFFTSPNSDFFASFIYKNHGGNYLNLILAVTCGLASWYYLRGLRRLEKSNPSGVFAFFTTCVAVAILVSYARGATIAMLAFLCCCVGFFVIHQLLIKSTARKPIVAVMLLIVFGFFMQVGLTGLNTHEAWSHLKSGLTQVDTSLTDRRVATEAALEMAKDYWRHGAGVGSFRFIFPLYQQHHPSIYLENGKRLYWEHAHNDIVEIAAEQGILGMIIMGAAGLFVTLRLIRGRFWANPLCGCILFGALLTLVQAWYDFPFHCPAVLLLWSVTIMLAVMWCSFEESNEAP